MAHAEEINFPPLPTTLDAMAEKNGGEAPWYMCCEIGTYLEPGDEESPPLRFYHLDDARQLYILDERMERWEPLVMEVDSDLPLGYPPRIYIVAEVLCRTHMQTGCLYLDSYGTNALYELSVNFASRTYR